MITKKTCFPVDIFAVKEYGIKKWQDEFFWPVSDTEFVNLAKDIRQCLRKQINVQPEEISDLLVIQRRLLPEYLHFFHALKVMDKIKEEGKDILYSKNLLWYEDIANGTLKNLNTLEKGRVKYGRLTKVRFVIKEFLSCRVYNIRFFHRYFNFKKGAEAFKAYGSVGSLMKQYIKKMPHSLRFTTRRDWLKEEAFYKTPEKLTDNIKEASKTLIDELTLAANKNGIRLYDNHITYLEGLTEKEMLDAAKMLHFAKTAIKDKGKVRLLVSGLSDSFSRALYMTIRRQDGEVKSFSHGNIGLYNIPTMAFSEFALSDEFITYTQKSAGLFERIKNNHPPLRNNKVSITSCESEEFFKLWRRHGNKPLPGHIRRVMIIGYPHSQWRKYQLPASLSLMQLDLELQMADILKNAGYDVIYKVHPNRIREVEGIFDDTARVFTKGYFQDYLDEADAFLFGNIKSTAFSIALCTNKPIVGLIIDSGPYQPFPEAMELLKKRCSIIETKFDERNRVVFDKEELKATLAKKPEQPNTEFVETYMFPVTQPKRGKDESFVRLL